MADTPCSGVDECAARPVARSRTRRLPRVAIASLLSVGSPLIRNCERRALALATSAPSLPRSSPTTNNIPTRVSPRRAQPLDGSDLRRQDALGVARSPAVQAAVAHRAGNVRRDAIEVRREHDDRLVERRDDVAPAVPDRLFLDVVAERAQPRGEPVSGRLFLARGRIDVDRARARTRATFIAGLPRARCGRRSARRGISR